MPQVILYRLGSNVAVCAVTRDEELDSVRSRLPEPTFVKDASDPIFTTDTDFFTAWNLNNDGTITVDMTGARDVTKARLREERKPLLAKLDIEFQRALETGAPTISIVAEKQRLRDITNLADAASTLEELRAIKCSKE